MESLTSWLLASPTPSLRYLTYRHLLGYAESHSDVQTTREQMRTTGPIPLILSKQTPAGHWVSDDRMYGTKYIGTHWSMIVLTELAADPRDDHLRRGLEFMLAATEHNHMLEGQFDKTVPSPEVFGFTCLWGNLLRYAAYCGLADDPRVTRIGEYVARNLTAGQCKCHINDYLPCAWGAARSLWGLAALPQRSASIQRAIEHAVDFLLSSEHDLPAGRYPSRGGVHALWGKLSFPTFYQADVLFVLRVLGAVNALAHPGAHRALAWLDAQRQPDGRWHGNNPFQSRTWRISGDRQDIHRWVSLHAALVMQQAEQQQAALSSVNSAINQ
jgi:hypothetical protein